MKYIFMVGAPGSKWSSVAKNIYFSPDVDHSDASPDREYWHDASGEMNLMHLGAYFDPGMEFDLSAQMNLESREMLEEFFDSAFSPDSEGVRIVKSHVFAHHIDFIKSTWPECPIVLVHREDDACLGWWIRCGHFNITYPTYDSYYVDLKHMAHHIDRQNADILTAMDKYYNIAVYDNGHLAHVLGLTQPPEEYFQDYEESDIRVTVI